MKIFYVLLFVVGLAGCTSTAPVIPELPVSKPPQLWSSHKLLEITADACGVKGYSALKSLGFSSVVKNKNYVYGNYHDNRAAVKCVPMGSGSFIYLAVAGPTKEMVEKLRNEISWKM